MRGLLVLLSTVLMAQSPPSKPAPAQPKPPVRKRPAGATAKSTAPAAKPAPPMTDDEKTIYALGLTLNKSIADLALTPKQVELVARALQDAAAGKPAIQLDEWRPKVKAFALSRETALRDQQKTASAEYLQKAAAEPGVEKTPSGLIYREIKPGTGASPKASDTVRVHYRGTLVNGTEFDSSYARNEPAEFPLTGVIPCWTEGLQKMKVGGKAQLVCPSTIAYGENGRPSIPGGAALIFEIELLDIPGAPR